MPLSNFEQNLQFLTIQRYTLRQVGIDLNATKRENLIQNYWKFISQMCVIIYLEYGLINAALHSSIDVAATSLFMINPAILIFLKVSVFFYNGDCFIKLIWKMNHLAEKANPKEYKEWLLENRRSQLIGKMYFYACWAAFGCSIIIPLSIMGYEYYKKDIVKHILPFGGKFPYDNGSVLHFIVNFIMSIISVTSLLNTSVGLDTLFGWYIFNVSGHFRILRVKVKTTALKLESGNSRDFTKDMGAIVCYHNKILNFVDDLNERFGYILWVQVMLSCIQICLIIYTLNNTTDYSYWPFHILTVVAESVQLMIYCFGGDKVQTENDMLCMDLYVQIPWHKMSIKEQKMMLLPLMRSQRPCTLTGLFFEVNRDLFVYIITTAFVFNALLSVLNK